MFDGIKRFQKENRLKVDGLMRPGGPTETAINQRLSGGRDAFRGIDTTGLFNQFNGFAASYDDVDAGPWKPKPPPPWDIPCRRSGTCENYS